MVSVHIDHDLLVAVLIIPMLTYLATYTASCEINFWFYSITIDVLQRILQVWFVRAKSTQEAREGAGKRGTGEGGESRRHVR
jgi:hypothetical protein